MSSRSIPGYPSEGHLGAAKRRTDAGLLGLRLRAFWRTMMDEPVSFWALCLYLFIEYVRPQQIYSAIDVLPYGDLALGLAVLAYVLEGAPTRRLHVLDVLLALFTGVLILSSVLAVDPDAAIGGWQLFLNWLVVYWLVSHVVTTERRFMIFWALFLLWSLKMSQHGARVWLSRGGAFAEWGAAGAPGWFQNSGEFAIQMCIFLPMAYHSVMALRSRLAKWKFWGLMLLLPGTAVVSLLASSSRGGQIGLVAVILFMIGQSRHRVRGLISAAAVLIVVWSVLPAEQKERFETMGEDNTSETRLTYWRHGIEIANERPLLGIGYENWLTYYRTNYNPRGQLPHNVFIEAWSEMGYLGLLAFVSLIGGTLYVNHRSRRLTARLSEWSGFLRAAALGLDAALIGYLTAGFFVTVLFYPFFWVNLALTASLHVVVVRRYRRARRAAIRQRGSDYSRRTSPTSVAGTRRRDWTTG